MLDIKNLSVSIEDKEILHAVDLKVGSNEIHVIMGPNGSGKSTLSKVIMGDPSIETTAGTITFKGVDITHAQADERAKLGIFLANQYPIEVPGVNLENFLRIAYNSKFPEKKLSVLGFREYIKPKLDLVDLPQDFLERNLNEGFSGGEKKKCEILQLAVLEPNLAILDETDSGLDIESLDLVFKAIGKLQKQLDMSLLIVTHYDRVFNYISPDVVHIMRAGKIIKEGGKELTKLIQEKGFKNLV